HPPLQSSPTRRSSDLAMMFDQVSTSAAHIRAGKLRALGVTTLTRSPLLPDVPTLDESGLAGFEDVTWNGYVAPAGTPPEVLTRRSEEHTSELQSLRHL